MNNLLPEDVCTIIYNFAPEEMFYYHNFILYKELYKKKGIIKSKDGIIKKIKAGKIEKQRKHKLINVNMDTSIMYMSGLICLDFSNIKEFKVNINIFKRFQNLEELRLSSTKVFGDIEVFKYLKKMRVIYLSHTKVDGDIKHLSVCKNLALLYLYGTKVHGNIHCFKDNIQLSTINLSYTGVEGDIIAFELLDFLKIVHLIDTECTGSVDREWGPEKRGREIKWFCRYARIQSCPETPDMRAAAHREQKREEETRQYRTSLARARRNSRK